ncbi:MAG: triose-phosphate isomerase [Hespellia sp.]|nr:triose-phosphate isomerase [Hespellia sp.]
MKNFIVGSGWKMVKSYQNTLETAKELEKKLEGFHDFRVVIYPSYPALPEVCRNVSPDSALKIGGQDMFWEEEGAFTGEVSGKMLLEIGCEYVEINHQERRRYLKEDNEMSNRKLRAAVKMGLKPFLCCGEEVMDTDEMVQAFIKKQLHELLTGVTAEEAKLITFAYEPMWAIGKKETANLGHIQMVHHYIRFVVEEIYGKEVADAALIVYGGGINMETYLDIASLPDVNGLFTTGCGIDPDTYSKLAITTAQMLKEKGL